MRIDVAKRFRPYSKLPGSACLIPGEDKIIQAWPSRCLVKTCSGELVAEMEGRSILFQELEKPFDRERLSFGNHKSQDVDLIRRRKDLTEILPIWFKLATHYANFTVSQEPVKPGSLLYELVNETDRNRLADLFLKTYLSGFSPFFVPRASDTDFNGFELPPLKGEEPLRLLIEGAKAIKRMIVEERDGGIHLLSCLPSLFHAGRLIETPLAQGGVISVEWTKHFVRRVIYVPQNEEDVNIRFPKEVKRYRVKASGKSFVFDNFLA